MASRSLATSDAILAYRAGDGVEAHALVARLAEAGVVARVLGESLQGLYPGVNLGGMNQPEVWVAATDRAAAEPVIAAWQAEHGVADAAPRWQFSFTVALAVTAYVAFMAGASVMSEAIWSIFVPLVNLLVFGGVAIVLWRKVRARRRELDAADSKRSELLS